MFFIFGGESMSEDQNCLRFSLEEDVHFQKGEEVCEVLSISLEPNVTCHEFDQYVILRGTLELVGEYVPCDTDTPETDFYAVQNCASVTPCEGSSNCQFFYAFPVDITIPAERVRSGEELNMGVQTLDCTINEDSCLHICAELYINGVYERELPAEEQDQLHVEVALEDTPDDQEAFLARNADYALPEEALVPVAELEPLKSYQNPDFSGFQFDAEVQSAPSLETEDLRVADEQTLASGFAPNSSVIHGSTDVPAPYTTLGQQTNATPHLVPATDMDVSEASALSMDTNETTVLDGGGKQLAGSVSVGEQQGEVAPLFGYQQPLSHEYPQASGWQQHEESQAPYPSEYQQQLQAQQQVPYPSEYQQQLQADQQASYRV